MSRFPGNPFAPRRRPTRPVPVGDVAVGGDQPIRVQSMTTTDTRDVAATADQIERLVDAGCEIARVTAPSTRDAEALAALRAELDRRRVRVPLVADIHFTPNAAMIAVEAVEKVRINPGNYADKKKFEIREYSDAQYAAELERVADRFRPLVRRCRELGRALRIGTNHGSLSDRVMNRYGDTPLGMVESALEFLEVCEAEGFHDVIFSMKASNPQVAIQAYRLLAARLDERPDGGPYPFHVGVTEAGDGEDGRIKSAIGIGSLLEDGLGDTIRVSLTEDPVREIPVARALARRAEARWAAPPPAPPEPGARFVEDPFAHARRASEPVVCEGVELGGAAPVRVELDLGPAAGDAAAAARALADSLAAHPDLACEGLRVAVPDRAAMTRAEDLEAAWRELGGGAPLAWVLPASLAPEAKGRAARWVVSVDPITSNAVLEAAAGAAVAGAAALEWRLSAPPERLASEVDRVLEATAAAGASRALLSIEGDPVIPRMRLAAAVLRARAIAWPLVLTPSEPLDALGAATELGSLLCDGVGDAVALPAGGQPGTALALAYRILQGARQRTSWTEFISCPSCGRTLFDLEETTARIRARTGHLKGVKIAIMGCIVNGPGEMADADFGYVGSGPGLVNLYVGQTCVERHVPAAEADRRLIELIRREGAWIEPT